MGRHHAPDPLKNVTHAHGHGHSHGFGPAGSHGDAAGGHSHDSRDGGGGGGAHGHGHGHAHGAADAAGDGRGGRLRFRRADWTPARTALALLLLVGAVVTAVAMVLQWPDHDAPATSSDFHQTSELGHSLSEGTVALRTTGGCHSPSVGRVFDSAPATDFGDDATCTQIIVDLTSGPDAGHRTLLMTSDVPGEPDLQPGDAIRLITSDAQDAPGQRAYAFQDYQRDTPVWLWVAATLVGIVIVGAWRGVRAIIGLAVTLVTVGGFLIPALARGTDPVPLAVTCCAAVLYLVLYLVHGISWKTSAALAGTLIAMLLGAVLGGWAVGSSQLRGLGDENNLQVLLYLPQVEITGLMLAGFTVGTLGVLNDVTVAQASTINELHELDPTAGPLRLFAAAMRVGRDHIASTLYTLVLTYAGAALPMLVLLSVSGRRLEQMLTSDVMAGEIMRSATGALALVTAVPLTTIIAAVTVRRRAARGTAPDTQAGRDTPDTGSSQDTPATHLTPNTQDTQDKEVPTR
ncbi:YibE/F family protein [Corynebacterium bovis]|uniref:YibE/F family protein n=1 Tax=Corynebacterium bovis TaxID=36808 RepID=UPI003139290B